MTKGLNQAFIDAHLKKAQMELKRELRRRSPKDTTKYAESWKLGPRTPRKAKVETRQGFLFKILEFTGSKPHIIRAKKANALHWIDKQTGGHRFAKFVHHPGFRPIPHARPAVKTIQNKLTTLMVKEIKAKLTGAKK